jgi:hypothetical protein
MNEEQIKWLKENIQLTMENSYEMYAGEYLIIELVVAGEVISSYRVQVKE